jgi:NPCBM/NEW2 domain
VYLDSLPLQHASVGYGQLCTHGRLGYEGKSVQVKRQFYKHDLSTHPPAHLAFNLEGRFEHCCCQVALNDDVAYSVTHADFIVLADGQQIAAATHVAAGQLPRELHADISGAQLLELVVKTRHWECSHAVWIDPQVEEIGAGTPASTLLDCLRRAEITLLHPRPRAKRCIGTVVFPGFEGLLDEMLGSLYANGGCQDALLVVFALGANIAVAHYDINEESNTITAISGAIQEYEKEGIVKEVDFIIGENRFFQPLVLPPTKEKSG